MSGGGSGGGGSGGGGSGGGGSGGVLWCVQGCFFESLTDSVFGSGFGFLVTMLDTC